MKQYLAIASLAFLGGCLGMPDKVSPVSDFELQRYLGKWYEIARLDHSFERGLEQVTAEYALREDGGVSVTNRGFSVDSQQWEQATGKAYVVGDASTAYLKVSFFGPFYGSYVVFGLDKEHYDYAFVSGPKLSYLWLLSRQKEVSPDVMKRFIAAATDLGFDTSELIYVKQD